MAISLIDFLTAQARLSGGGRPWRWRAQARWLQAVQLACIRAQCRASEFQEMSRELARALGLTDELLPVSAQAASQPEALVVLCAAENIGAALIEAAIEYYSSRAGCIVASPSYWLPLDNQYVTALAGEDAAALQRRREVGSHVRELVPPAITARQNLIIEAQPCDEQYLEPWLRSLRQASYSIHLCVLKMSARELNRELQDIWQMRRGACGFSPPAMSRNELVSAVTEQAVAVANLLKHDTWTTVTWLDHRDNVLEPAVPGEAVAEPRQDQPPTTSTPSSASLGPRAFRLGNFSNPEPAPSSPPKTEVTATSNSSAQDLLRRTALQDKLRRIVSQDGVADANT